MKIPVNLSVKDIKEIERLLRSVGTSDPKLEDIWMCMDAVWDQLGCDNFFLDMNKIEEFYRHPVWLLNGLFVEHDPESLKHREVVSNWILNRDVRRVADLGGGFGTLARMVAVKCPQTNIEVVEPYPHPLAIAESEKYKNISYSKNLSGSYDLIVAMDVFEHLSDPLKVVFETSHFLKMGGIYLAANCFEPVIKCHLPSTFHFRHSWNLALRKLELNIVDSVSYGSAFEKTGKGSLQAARIVEFASRKVFPLAEKSDPIIEQLMRLRSRLKLRTRAKDVIASLSK